MSRHLRALQQRLGRQQRARLAPLVQAQDLPINIAASQSAKLQPGEFDAAYLPKRDAFRALRQGRGSDHTYREMADAVNLGTVLMTYQLANDHAATFEAAHAALVAVLARHAATRSWTLRAAEITALDDALQVFRAQLLYCSRGEFCRAFNTLAARAQAALRGDIAPGTVVVQPGTSTATR